MPIKHLTSARETGTMDTLPYYKEYEVREIIYKVISQLLLEEYRQGPRLFGCSLYPYWRTICLHCLQTSKNKKVKNKVTQ